jgi:shikimate dehydrogenase
MHNAAFEALRLPWHYSLLPSPPGEVRSVLAQIRDRGWRGANVTVPHKQAVMPYLDALTAAGRAIGAVNTISVKDGRLIGHNTDGDGFLAALRESGFDPTNRAVLVLGAGGGARSVVYALAQAGCGVTLHNRTEERAARLIRDLQGTGSRKGGGWLKQTASLQGLELSDFDLLVNTTPLGMWPNIDASPWPEELAIPSHWTVYDLVYNPEQTRLLSQVQAAGATPVGGLGMLVHQGALAFELWTGQAPPLEVMAAAAKEALA